MRRSEHERLRRSLDLRWCVLLGEVGSLRYEAVAEVSGEPREPRLTCGILSAIVGSQRWERCSADYAPAEIVRRWAEFRALLERWERGEIDWPAEVAHDFVEGVRHA